MKLTTRLPAIAFVLVTGVTTPGQELRTPNSSAINRTRKQAKPITINCSFCAHQAISLPKPEYPKLARYVKVSGPVSVDVLIDGIGNVISARAVSGHPLLR